MSEKNKQLTHSCSDQLRFEQSIFHTQHDARDRRGYAQVQREMSFSIGLPQQIFTVSLRSGVPNCVFSRRNLNPSLV